MHRRWNWISWAGNRATRLGDAWISGLKLALDRLASQETRRCAFDPRYVRSVVEERYEAVAPPLHEWYTAHCDLHWNNLTAPELAILDWEVWGLAPPGYDIAMLLAYSANDPALVARLEQAFAPILARREVRATRIYVLHLVVEMTENGHLDPEMREPVARMLDAALTSWRASA